MTGGKRLLAKVTPTAVLIRGVAHPHRLAILYILAHEPTWPEDIARHLPVPVNLISHHLRSMVHTGWLKKRRIGRHVIYSVNRTAVKSVPKIFTDTPFWREQIKHV